MLHTKSRKQGSSIVITLPPSNGEKPELDKEYLVVYAVDGTIILVPKLDDPFTNGTEGEFYATDDWVDVSPEGRELL